MDFGLLQAFSITLQLLPLKRVFEKVHKGAAAHHYKRAPPTKNHLSKTVVITLEQGCATRCSLAAGLRGNGERMRKWRENEEIERRWRENEEMDRE